MKIGAALGVLLWIVAGCAHRPQGPIVPVVDYHAHLISPAAAKLQSNEPLPSIALPPELAQLLSERTRRYNDKDALAELYTEDALVLDPFGPEWMRGRDRVAGYLSGIFEEPYAIEPVAFGVDRDSGYIAGYSRDDDATKKYFAHILLSLRKENGAWRIAAESPVYEGPAVRQAVTSAELVAQLDDAGIQKAIVLSVAYWFGRPSAKVADEYAAVRAENDWVAAEVAKHPSRLIGFCSFNPLRDYALTELDRCATTLRLRGLKLHLGNSRVDVRKPEHAETLRRVFAAANRHRLPIVLHMWTSAAYETEGRAHAEAVLNELLPAAPDIPIQIAHMAGGGRSTQPALAVFAEAIAAGDPRTKHLYFDVATLTGGQSDEGLRKDAERMRQIGLDRILYGTDAVPPNPPARRSWGTFRAFMPLTDDELRIIASNVTPYAR